MSTLQTTFIQKLGAGTDAFEIPANDGTSGQYLQTNGTGGLSWQTVDPAAFESYAVICDSKATGVDGGSATSGAFRTRDLNTEISDQDGIVSIASNQFTLAAGNYLIRWSAPACNVSRHQTRLRDITNTATVSAGTAEYVASVLQTRSFGSARVSITGNTVYEVQHLVQTTVANIGFGFGQNTGENQIYTLVEIFREA